MSSISFDAIRQQVRVLDLLTRMGWSPTRLEPTGHRGPCPIHRSRPGSRSLWVSPDGRDWHCHSCGKGGRCLALVCALRPELSVVEAAREVCRIMGIAVPYVSHRRGRGYESATPDREEDQ